MQKYFKSYLFDEDKHIQGNLPTGGQAQLSDTRHLFTVSSINVRI